MGRNPYSELSGICSYAKVKYEEKVQGHRRKRSASEPTTTTTTPSTPPKNHVYGKLHKPPTVQDIHERPPRNKLQKRSLTAPETQSRAAFLFLLEYEPYPYNTHPSTILGVYSSIDSVTLGAFKHGAYTFSREGFLDGSEYLSPTGRIKILSQAVETHGVKAAVVPERRRRRSLGGGGEEPVRLDIPHPAASQEEVVTIEEEREVVFLAIHRGPHTAFCIGLFAELSLAWGACLKNKASYDVSGTLVDEERSIGAKNMPHVAARLVGSGRHSWFVQVHEVDGLGP